MSAVMGRRFLVAVNDEPVADYDTLDEAKADARGRWDRDPGELVTIADKVRRELVLGWWL